MASVKDNMLQNGYERLSQIGYGLDRSGLDYLRAGPLDTEMDKGITPSTLTYSNAETSYSGTDCVISIVYNEHIVVLGNVETVSYSIHRDKVPVRTLGRTYAKNYTRGQRTIAGSLIFVQFDEAPLYKLYEFFNKKLENQHRFSSPLADEIPPFDMMLTFSNEYGYNSIIKLYGIEIVDEGGTFSINDIYSENVMQFIAKDIDPMVSEGAQGSYQKLLYEKMLQGKVIDEHYNSMLKYRQKLEFDLTNAKTQLSSLSRSASRAKPDKTYRTDRARTRNQSRMADRQKYDALETKMSSLAAEILRMNNTINSYEKNNMTWDMNSALESNYTSTPAFTASTTPREGLTNNV